MIVFFIDRTRFEYHSATRLWREVSPDIELYNREIFYLNLGRRFLEWSVAFWPIAVWMWNVIVLTRVSNVSLLTPITGSILFGLLSSRSLTVHNLVKLLFSANHGRILTCRAITIGTFQKKI